VNVTGWSRGLEVTGGGRGVVSHAGLALNTSGKAQLRPAANSPCCSAEPDCARAPAATTDLLPGWRRTGFLGFAG
jgi:hypothetical protein